MLCTLLRPRENGDFKICNNECHWHIEYKPQPGSAVSGHVYTCNDCVGQWRYHRRIIRITKLEVPA